MGGTTQEFNDAVAFNREFCALNGIPWDRRQNQIALMQYFKTIVKNQRSSGGKSYHLPGELPKSDVPPASPSPIPPPSVPAPHPNMDTLENILMGAQSVVNRLSEYIRTKK